MRDPRPGLAWSHQRIARRDSYGCWMASPGWSEVRRRWQREWIRHGGDPSCAVCGGGRSLAGGDLHHRSYRRLGAECFEDLVPLHRDCHDRVHELWDTNPMWRRIDRAFANDLIIGLLRNRSTGQQET